MKNIIYWFTGGQTYFSTSWHAKMRLALHELLKEVLCSNLQTDQKHAPKTYRTWKVLDGKQPTPDQNSGWFKG